MRTAEVVLNPFEMRFAASVGCERNVANIVAGRKHLSGGTPEHGWTQNIVGALAELAVAKWTGAFWSGAIGDFKADDVGRLQVRSTQPDDGCLMIYDRDREDRQYILVTGVAPRLTLRGWMWGWEGKNSAFFHPNRRNRGPAYWVPQHALHPMDCLHEAARLAA